MESKNELIDIAKGIGIILVVAGHCMEFPKNYIYLFHMPLFFFLSGYCYKEKYNQNLSNIFILLKKRIKSLYFPFVKYGLLFVLLHNFFYDIYVYSMPELWSHNKMTYFFCVQDWIKAIIGILTFSRLEQMLNPFWFLPALFIVTMLFAFISYITKFIKYEDLMKAIFIYFYFLFACFFNTDENKLLRIITISSLGLLSFYLGFLYKKYIKQKIYSYRIAFLCILILVSNSIYGHINVSNFEFSSPGFYIISSLSGIYLVLFFSNVSSNFPIKNFLKYLGNITIEIMALHYISFKLVSWIIINYYILPENYLGYPTLFYGTIWDLFYCIIGIILPVILINVFKIKDYIFRG